MSLDLVRVPGRELHVGDTLERAQEIWRDHDDLGLPWHYFAKQTGSLDLVIPDLEVQRSPVTWAELASVAPELVTRYRGEDEGDDFPADHLLWEEATGAATLLAEQHGLALRIPTEFEWERIARGDDDRRFPWGEEFDPECANLIEAGIGAPERVGQRPAGASQHGVLDLIGNIDEWTSSVYAPLPEAHWTVPLTETWAADTHGTRGGSFSHHRDLALSRRRHGLYRPWDGAGFRLVVSHA